VKGVELLSDAVLVVGEPSGCGFEAVDHRPEGGQVGVGASVDLFQLSRVDVGVELRVVLLLDEIDLGGCFWVEYLFVRMGKYFRAVSSSDRTGTRG
jgi:hypothetical protein